MNKHSISLFIFRRDLRIVDNIGLFKALTNSEQVIPTFIFDPRQINDHPYKSTNGLQFLIEALKSLDHELRKLGSRLFVWQGQPEEIIKQLKSTIDIKAVFLNRDYTPFSIERDRKISEICHELGMTYSASEDALLTNVNQVLKPDKKPYTIYTPFYRSASKFTVAEPIQISHKNFYKQNLENLLDLERLKFFTKTNPNLYTHGDRDVALNKLSEIKEYSNYDQDRNIPALHATTGLSAHLKFGTVSAREVYHIVAKELGTAHTLIRELYWRDFFTLIGLYFSHVYKGCFHRKYDKIKWENDNTKFDLWCQGKTGFPIVDAGMRELNTTGFMHNRVRMIVASFLTKDLLIDWRWGEKYFATKLVDYDPAVNNGNWQWAASTGCDAQPYFRIFNPWLQQEKFDPECKYIKQWVPELKSLEAKGIHKLLDSTGYFNYPEQIVVHAERKELAEDLYREC